MIVKNNPYLIEYNVRMGDPECQTILPLLESDFLDLIDLFKMKNYMSLKLSGKIKSVCIVTCCSKGYPTKYINNLEIDNIEKINTSENNFIFHAGTKYVEIKIFFKWWKSAKFCKCFKRF